MYRGGAPSPGCGNGQSETVAGKHLVQALESGRSEVLTQYLGTMARFHTYSFGNVMLIARQKPDASNVAGIRTWNSLGRFVKRGEKGILILAPMVGYRRLRQEETAADTTIDAKEERKQQLVGFRAVYVFERLSRDLWPRFYPLDRDSEMTPKASCRR